MRAESGLTLHQRSPDEIPLNSPMFRHSPGTFGPCGGSNEVAKPVRAFAEVRNDRTFALAIAAFYAQTPTPAQRDVPQGVVSRRAKQGAKVLQTNSFLEPIF